MDFFFDDRRPSTSLSPPKSRREDSQMVACNHVTPETQQSPQMTGDTDSRRGKSLSVSMTEIQEQHARMTSPPSINCSSSIDDISRRVQDLVEKINDSRTSDQNVMDSFQEKFMEKVTQMCQQMKDHMYTVYEENGNEMQVKLQELSKVLESCSKLNKELMEASRALAGLREGLAISQTSEP